MPQVSDEIKFIFPILGIAIFILVALLAAVVFVYYYEHRRDDEFTWNFLISKLTELFPKAVPKEKRPPVPLADVIATSVSEPAPNIELESVSPPVENTILLLEGRTTNEVRQTSEIQIVNWFIWFSIVVYVAFLGYDRLQHYLFLLLQISIYFYWFAILLAFISPTCIAVACLRLTGVKWRQALLLFPFVPVGVQLIYFMLNFNN